MTIEQAPRGGRWRYRGLNVLKGERPGGGSPHLPGLEPDAALAQARAGAARIRTGAVPIDAFAGGADHAGGSADAAAGGDVIFVSRGKARFRFGPHGEFLAEAEAGDFVFVPPGFPFRLLNAAPGRPLDCIRVHPDGSARAVPDCGQEGGRDRGDEEVLWMDPVRERDG